MVGLRSLPTPECYAINTKDNRIASVTTDKGEIQCEIVINCGGMFAAEIGRLVDVRIPIIPMSHQYSNY